MGVKRFLFWVSRLLPSVMCGGRDGPHGVQVSIEGGVVVDGGGAVGGRLEPAAVDLHLVRGVVVATVPRPPPPAGDAIVAEWFSADAAASGREPCLELSPRTARIDAAGCLVLPAWFADARAVAAGESFAGAWSGALRAALHARLADVVIANTEFPTAQRYGVRTGDRCACIIVELPAGVAVGPDVTCGDLQGGVVRAVVVNGVVLPPTARVTADLMLVPRPMGWPNLTGVPRPV